MAATLKDLSGLESSFFVGRVAQAFKEESKSILEAEMATPGSEDPNDVAFAKKIFNGNINVTNLAKNALTQSQLKNLDNPNDAPDPTVRSAVRIIFPTIAYASES